MEVIDNVPVKLELDDVVKKTRIRSMNDNFKDIINELLDMVHPIAKPKALFEISRVENRQGDLMEIGGIKFTSHILRVNLDRIDTVFPYIVTCGREVDEIEIPASQMLKYYFMDQIREIITRSTLNYLVDHIRNNHAC
jgi:hypothetical protein